MSVLSVSSFLQPLNGFGASKQSSNDKAASGSSSDNNPAFVLDLSDKAKQLMAAELPSETKNVDAFKKPVSLSDSVKEQSKNVQDKMTRLLLSRNIDFSADMDLEIDSSGKIRVKGDIANKDAIEEALNGDSSLSSELKQLLNDSSSLATQKAEAKYKAALKILEEDDDEDKEKKKLEMEQKYINIVKQIGQISNDFSFKGGALSIASLDFVANTTF